MPDSGRNPPNFVSPGQCWIRNGVLPILHQATRENRSIKEGSSPCLLVPISFSRHGKDPPLKASPFVSRFPHPHLPVALRRLGRTGRGAGDPGPASGVAAPRTQRGPGHGGRPPAPEAASEPACGSLRHSRKREGQGLRKRRMGKSELEGRMRRRRWKGRNRGSIKS